ncbi:hypothetical protein [uncultured Polaribacter sp.]|uniref:hypothetical protein n=1 Tax=uncultured Polaribacter sp. TaxID=174711 RepID=UPI00261D225A|nr:hypothetical protein [uncultured Polaribacter sp.]
MNKILKILLFASLVLIYSCDDADKLNADSITNGAVLTTVEEINLDIDKGDPGASTASVTVQFADFIDNNSLESVDVYVQFIDTTPVDNVVVSIDEAFLKNVSASEFTMEDSVLLVADQLPTYTFSFTGSEAIAATGVDTSILDGGDLFIMRLVVKLTDGSEYTSTNVGEDVAVTSHNTPFRYAATVKCLTPLYDLSGTWSGVTNATNTDGQTPATDLATTVTISAAGTSGLDYTIIDAYGGAYIFHYGAAYGASWEIEGTFSEICGTTLTGTSTDHWGQVVDLNGTIIDSNTISISWTNPWGDEGTTVYTR